MQKASTLIAIVVLIAGFAIGGWRAWKQVVASAAGTAINNDVTVPLLTTQAKAVFIRRQVEAYNAQHSNVQIVLKYVEARDAMSAIIYNKEHPLLWYPDSPVWIERVNDLWSAGHGKRLIDTGRPSDFRVTMRSPLVFLTTQSKAQFLRPQLSGPNPWHTIGRLSRGEIRTPWGGFRLAHADPLDSNSGILTLALAASEYSSDLTSRPELAVSSGFFDYLSDIEHGASTNYHSVFDLTEKYTNDHNMADLVVTDESAAIEAIQHNPDFAVIYPSPTMVEEETVCVVDGPWSTPAQLDDARDFVAFLGGDRATHDAAFYHMRPPDDAEEATIDQAFNKASVQGVRQSYVTVGLPPYQVLNSLAYSWRLLQHGRS